MNTQAIYPNDFAKELMDRAGESYQPSNGTEGDCFRSAWCEQCARDKHLNGQKDWDLCDESEICMIVLNTMAYNIGDAEYPKEWIYGKDGQPCCTAFIAVGDPIPPEPDTHTLDMFDRAALSSNGNPKGSADGEGV